MSGFYYFDDLYPYPFYTPPLPPRLGRCCIIQTDFHEDDMFKLVNTDFSQEEIRIAAVLCGEGRMPEHYVSQGVIKDRMIISDIPVHQLRNYVFRYRPTPYPLLRQKEGRWKKFSLYPRNKEQNRKKGRKAAERWALTPSRTRSYQDIYRSVFGETREETKARWACEQ